ncbi:LysR family transcriptional regulator [Streptomyces apocyni]|uniref:LysR family transcriptional regulator n=1 Tax=Streptomyces apocyni TaxID=2654677 RepID=UPI0012E9E76A|nr:LysR substrate-binding domain-containing protein [Streptomyces apocyni]
MYDPSQLRTFLAVAQTLSFTQAAHRLGLRQSTASQHVRRLEDTTGRQLFTRDTHSVRLTEDGAAMLGFARTILRAHEQAEAFFTGTRLRGRLRFGASEDFVLTQLPQILSSFRREHPEVDLELSVELSGTLHERLAEGRLDLVLAKRGTRGAYGTEIERARETVVWHDELVWIGAEGLRLAPDRPVPLIAYPPPGITRARALEVLERHGRPWWSACTSGSLNGLLAAAHAGLGVMAHSRGLIPPGLTRVRSGLLPELGGVDFVLLYGAGVSGARGPAQALAAAILASGDRLRGSGSGRVGGSGRSGRSGTDSVEITEP